MSTAFYAYAKSARFNDEEYLRGLNLGTRKDQVFRQLIEDSSQFKEMNTSYENLSEEEIEALSWQPEVDSYLRNLPEFDFYAYWDRNSTECLSLDDIRLTLKVNKDLIRSNPHNMVDGQGSLAPLMVYGALPPENFKEAIRLLKSRSYIPRKTAELIAFLEELEGKDYFLVTG